MDHIEPLDLEMPARHDDKVAALDVPHPAEPGRPPGPVAAKVPRHPVLGWLRHDLPFIVMMLLAVTAVIFRVPFVYWIVLIPMFGIISIVTGWRHFTERNARLELVFRLALTWCALLLAIYLLFSGGVRAVLNSNADSLAMLTLLALGTFISGVEAREWRICAVGGLLFLAVPGLGWADQSPLLLISGTVIVIAAGGFAWWVSQNRGGE